MLICVYSFLPVFLVSETDTVHAVQSNISKFSAQNAHKLQEDIASPTAAKGIFIFWNVQS